MKFCIFIVIILIACINSASIINDNLFENEWHIFKTQHTKTYNSYSEEKLRREIFLNNKYKVDIHNEKFKKGLVSFKLGINKYADLSQSELVGIMNGFKINEIQGQLIEHNFKISTNSINHLIPETFDWREHGAVTRVKDQGNCASCWAFSTTGSLEGQNFLKNGKLIELSEQNLIDCTLLFGNTGCKGGNSINSYEYVINYGINTEISYPYEGYNNKCRYNSSNIGTKIKGFIRLPSGDEEKLKEAISTIGPISAIIDANHTSILFYKGGIINEPQCHTSLEYLNHAILIVGYGTDESGQDYWLVKNSWGKTSGEKGYFRIIRNKRNHCGIATLATYPLI